MVSHARQRHRLSGANTAKSNEVSLQYKHLSYLERLQKLGLTTLKTRRLRGDLIETYKIITRKERIDPQHFFTFANPPFGLRGHSVKIYKPTVELNIRKNFFITGTSCLSTLWTLHPPIHSRTDWTRTGASRIWAFKACLLSPSLYKYKYKITDRPCL